MTVEAHNITVIDGADIVISMTRTDDDQEQEIARIVLGAADATALCSDILLAVRRHQGR